MPTIRLRSLLFRVILCVLVLSCGVSYAQSTPCTFFANVPQPPPGENCYFVEFLGYYCPVYSCPPPDPPPCGDCSGGRPIDLLTGNTFITETDVKIPGLSGGMRLTRTWNSKWPALQTAYQVGLFGPNWRSTYEERIFRDSNSYVRYLRGDGAFWAFGGFSPMYLVAPSNGVATLTYDSNYTYWTLAFQNGEKRIFSYLSGSLTSIIDRNGNTTSLSYDALNRLVTVTDPGGRHLYFNYPNGSSYLVSSVTSDVGITVTYSYDSQNRLSKVTENDGSFVTFTYDTNSNITAVKDSLGNLLESHTYDNEHRGLTSSRGSAGAEAVTVSYPNP
jgi:YD repeat-containing protein